MSSDAPPRLPSLALSRIDWVTAHHRHGSAERMEAVGAGSAPLGDPPPGPLAGLSVGSGLPLFDPIDPNRFGVRLLPDVGPQALPNVVP